MIVLAELYFGTYKSQHIEENRRVIQAIENTQTILFLDLVTADLYGRIKQGLRARGRPIPENDIWIAALALQHELTVLSQDTHFDEIDDLNRAGW